MKINVIGHLVKTNPIQTQSKPVLSAVEWANLQNAKMDVSLYVIEDYRKKDDFAVRKNKPNSNPISEKPEMSANAFSQKDYENETAFRPQKNKPKQSQFQAGHLLIDRMKPKMSANSLLAKDYENITTLRPQKNKAKNKPNQTQSSVLCSLPSVFCSLPYLPACDRFISALSARPSLFRCCWVDCQWQLGRGRLSQLRCLFAACRRCAGCTIVWRNCRSHCPNRDLLCRRQADILRRFCRVRQSSNRPWRKSAHHYGTFD